MGYEFGNGFIEYLDNIEHRGTVVLDAFQKARKDAEERMKAFEYKAVEAKLTNEFKKRYNIGENDGHFYNLEYKGRAILYPASLFTSDTIRSINTSANRYVVLAKYYETIYDENVIKHCHLKSKYHLESNYCIFDKEKNEIIYEPKLGWNGHLTIYGNVVKANATFMKKVRENPLL